MALRVRSIASVMSLGFLITLTSARQPTEMQQPGAVHEVDIFNYGEVDKTCMRWTDGCRNCSRGTRSIPDLRQHRNRLPAARQGHLLRPRAGKQQARGDEAIAPRLCRLSGQAARLPIV